MLGAQLFEDTHETGRGDRGVNLDMQRLAVEVVLTELDPLPTALPLVDVTLSFGIVFLHFTIHNALFPLLKERFWTI